MTPRWVTVADIAGAYGWSLEEARRFVDGQNCPKLFRQGGTLAFLALPVR